MRRRARKRWRGLAVRYSHKLPGEGLLVAIPLAAALGALLRFAILLSGRALPLRVRGRLNSFPSAALLSLRVRSWRVGAFRTVRSPFDDYAETLRSRGRWP